MEDHVHCHYIVPSSAPLYQAGLGLLRPCDLLQTSAATVLLGTAGNIVGVSRLTGTMSSSQIITATLTSPSAASHMVMSEDVLSAGVTTAEMASLPVRHGFQC